MRRKRCRQSVFARAHARARAWKPAGPNAVDHQVSNDDPVIIDLDASLTDAHSEKQHAALKFKHGFGFHSLWSFIDHGPGGAGEPAAVMLRPGNAGSNTAADHKQILADAWPSCRGNGRGGLVGKCWSAPIPAAEPMSSSTTAAGADWGTRSGSPSPTTSSPRWTPTCAIGIGTRPTTPKDRSGPVLGTSRSLASPTCPGGRPGCGCWCVKNARIRVRSCGSPTVTGCG
ncbi:DDE family transposase [Nocardia puris]|uniref:DDE family transposase n=1 Tax=Nocardia puris TaxID=208602 RepID=A0A366DN99_9NOCA|nr:DDE family transposase [Nocardia puris]